MLLLKANISRRDPREYTLTVDRQQVGILRAGALIFSGYESLASARAAAETAVPVFTEWHSARWHTKQLAAVKSQSDPQLELRSGSILVGMLLRPGDAEDVDSYGFALRIPDHLWVAAGLGLAQRIYSALTLPVAMV